MAAPIQPPDLAALAAYCQQKLRLQDWRIDISYARDLTNGAGAPVWGLCKAVADAKVARIIIRDPATPPEGVSTEGAMAQIASTVMHELVHLHFAAFENRTTEAVVAEEQAVWAIAEALMMARGTAGEAALERAMVARISEAAAHCRRVGTGEAKMADASAAPSGGGTSMGQLTAIAAALGLGSDASVEDIVASIGAIVASLKKATADEAAEPPDPADPADAPMAAGAVPGGPAKPGDPAAPDAKARRAEVSAAATMLLSVTAKPTHSEALAEVTRWREIVVDVEKREKKLADDTKALESGERMKLCAVLVQLGAETPHTSGLADKKLVPRLANEPIADMRSRVAQLSVNRSTVGPGVRPPVTEGATGAHGLTERELAICKEQGCEPATFAALKARRVAPTAAS